MNTKNSKNNKINYDELLAFESVKSRHLTKFVNVRKSNLNVKYNDIIPLFIGYENCLPNHSFGPFARSSYLIHYVTEGKGVFVKKGKKYKVGKGEAFIISPDEITTYTADNLAPWSYVWIAFNGSLAKELDYLERPVVKLSDGLFSEVKNMVLGNTAVYQEEITSIIFKIFSQIFSSKNQIEDVAMQIVNYIDTQYMTDITVDGIASSVGFDRRYVGRMFKKLTGISVQEYIIKTRLDRAKELLKRGYKVSATAVMCGYNDQFNFTKMFTKRVGVSPREYAKQYK